MGMLLGEAFLEKSHCVGVIFIVQFRILESREFEPMAECCVCGEKAPLICLLCDSKTFCYVHACRHFSDEDLKRYTAPPKNDGRLFANSPLGPVEMIDPVVEGRKNRKSTVVAIIVGIVVFGSVMGTTGISVYVALICAIFIGGIAWAVMQDL
jgi:hypothetical protein